MVLASHGWGKLIEFGEKAAVFPDPFGVGSMMSLSFAIFAEVFCVLAVIM
jgi:putative oxidoreductase